MMKKTISKLYDKVLRTNLKIDKLKEQAKKELIHERVEELYRGRTFVDKCLGIIKILSA